MTIERARQLIGEIGKKLSDEEILGVIRKMKVFADICVEKIESNCNKNFCSSKQ